MPQNKFQSRSNAGWIWDVINNLRGKSEEATDTIPQASFFLIAGLGNPGRRYQKNRHNVGFMLMNHVAARLDVHFSTVESKSLITKTDYQGRRLILAKPQTYMNLSGQAISSLVRFYKIPLENLLIAVDDIDLPLGTLRIRPSGGSAGQKGMASIIDHLGTQDFPRLRIGIDRPTGQRGAAHYVLEDFSSRELELLQDILERSVDAVLTFTSEGLEKAMTAYNATPAL